MGNAVEFNASLDADKRTRMKNEAFDRFMAIFLLRASDKTIYCKMQDDYRMDYTNNKDNYPKSVADMRQVKVKTTSQKSPHLRTETYLMGRRMLKLSPRKVLHKAEKLFVMSAASQTSLPEIARLRRKL